MSPNQRLRAYAIGDLQRFCPTAHYWMRDHDPIADRDLTGPLIARYASLGLTVRELDAANALHSWAIYEIRYRAIFSVASPVRTDINDSRDVVGTTPAQDIEIAARYEMYRQAALAYARTLNDEQLIEAYQLRNMDKRTEHDSQKKESVKTHRIDADPERGSVPTRFVLDVCDKMENEGKRTTTNSVWIRLSSLVGIDSSIIVDKKDDVYLCNVGEDNLYPLKKGAVKGILQRRRERRKERQRNDKGT